MVYLLQTPSYPLYLYQLDSGNHLLIEWCNEELVNHIIQLYLNLAVKLNLIKDGKDGKCKDIYEKCYLSEDLAKNKLDRRNRIHIE